MAEALASALYPCRTTHLRLRPKQHRLDHQYFLFALELSELSRVRRSLLGFYQFRPADFLYPGDETLDEKLDRAYAQFDASRPEGRTLFLGLPRVAGYLFNPVCFFFQFDADNQPSSCLVQVGNTFGEYKLFLLQSPKDGRFQERCAKEFYVSPFSKLDTDFEFDLHVPDEHLEMRINSADEEGVLLYTDLIGKRIPFSTANLIWQTIRCPLVTTKVIFLIHWHALVLWLKGNTAISKADTLAQQKGIIRPQSHE